MKILVINASANKERSTTLKLTRTFLEGLDVEASEVEFVTTIGLNINPCRACYACWFKTAGKCVQNTRQPNGYQMRHRHISIPPCSLPKHSSRP